MSDDQQPKYDPNTGLKERSIDISSVLRLKNVLNFGKPKGTDLFDRVEETVSYVNGQRDQEIWLYSRRILSGVNSELLAMDENNNIIYGINFASADYLGLAQNEFAIEAAIKAAKDFGVNSAGSPLAFGAVSYTHLTLPTTPYV